MEIDDVIVTCSQTLCCRFESGIDRNVTDKAAFRFTKGVDPFIVLLQDGYIGCKNGAGRNIRAYDVRKQHREHSTWDDAGWVVQQW